MNAPAMLVYRAPRPSQVIAEALVERHSPSQITARATRLGLPRQLTQAMLAACCGTAVDRHRALRHRAAGRVSSF